jgi:hypothetical protein
MSPDPAPQPHKVAVVTDRILTGLGVDQLADRGLLVRAFSCFSPLGYRILLAFLFGPDVAYRLPDFLS